MLSQTFSWEAEHAFSQSGAVGNTDNKKPDRNQKYDYVIVAMDGEYLNELSAWLDQQNIRRLYENVYAFGSLKFYM